MTRIVSQAGTDHASASAVDAGKVNAFNFRALERFFHSRHLVWLFLAFSIPACIFLTLATPPFQTPDAPNHFFRAYQVSRGVLIGEHVLGSSGGQIDSGVVRFGEFEEPVRTRPERKWTQELEQRARTARFTHEEIPTVFGNTAPYPPINYLPQALAFRVLVNSPGGLMPVYHLACLFNAVSAIALTAFALVLSKRTRPVIFVTALLPMTLSLMASVSQDATLIPMAFVAIAWFDRRAGGDNIVDRRSMALISLLLICVAVARIPYIALSLLILDPRIRVGLAGYALRRRTIWLAIVVLASASIYLVENHLAGGTMRPGRSMGGQTAYLLSHISDLPGLIYRTMIANGNFYIQSFIGILGWLDTSFSRDHYRVSAAVIILSILYAAFLPNIKRPVDTAERFAWIWPWGAFVASSALTFYGLYAFWSEVGAQVIEGVQGRYFLPIFPLLAVGIMPFIRESVLRSKSFEIIRGCCVCVFCVFPVFTLFNLMAVVMRRFYLG